MNQLKPRRQQHRFVSGNYMIIEKMNTICKMLLIFFCLCTFKTFCQTNLTDTATYIIKTDSTATHAFFETRHYNNGHIKAEGWVIQRRYNNTYDQLSFFGIYKSYHRNGKIKVVTNYNIKSEPIDSSLFYDRKGRLSEIAIHTGAQNEAYLAWINNGILFSGKLKNNFYSKVVDKNGALKMEGLYRNDHKIGVWKYYKKGKLVKQVTHKPKKKS